MMQISHCAMTPGRDDQASDPNGNAYRIDRCRALVRETETIDRELPDRFHMNPNLAMLLSIYLGEAEGREMYMFGVAQAATAASSTAHRKLSKMVKLGYLARDRTPVDHRRVCVRLTPNIRSEIEAMLDKLPPVALSA